MKEEQKLKFNKPKFHKKKKNQRKKRMQPNSQKSGLNDATKMTQNTLIQIQLKKE